MRPFAIAWGFIVFLLVVISTVGAVDIFSDNFESYSNEEDINGAHGWLVETNGWSGWNPGFYGSTSFSVDGTSYNPYEGSVQGRLRTGNRYGNENRLVGATNSFTTEGYNNIYFSYARRTGSFESTETEQLAVYWTSDGGDNWAQLEKIEEDEGYALKNESLGTNANNNPDFGIRFVLRADSGNDIALIDSVQVTGCLINGQICSANNECCGGHCCSDGGGSYCSSESCCVDDANPCAADNECCSFLSGGCDLGDTDVCFSCEMCEGLGPLFCGSEDNTQCEEQCGSDVLCDDKDYNSSWVYGNTCYSCPECEYLLDYSVESCFCSEGSCGDGYCLDAITKTCYYGVSCSIDGWNY